MTDTAQRRALLHDVLRSRVYGVARETPLRGCRVGWARRSCSSARTCSRRSASSCAAHGRLDAVFVPVGGGGLLAGVGGYLKALMPGVAVIGVEPFLAGS